MKLSKIFDSFMKFIVLVVVLHGLGCVTMSYILAFKDHTTVEALSQTVITEIIAPIVAYTIKSTIENISKYNNWIDKIVGEKKEEMEETDED